MLLVLLKVTPLKNLIRFKSHRPAITCPASCPTTCTATSAHDGLCEKLTEAINTTGDVDCSLTATAASNFKTATPNFVTANGIRYFNFGSSADVNGIYTIYVDIDGSKRNGVLNEDVLAFNIYQNGCVIPEQNSMAANSTNYITAVIQYKNSSGATVRPLQGVSYREALCKAGRGPSTAYCTGYTTLSACDTSSGNYCEVMVINGNRGTSATCMPTSDITVVDPTLNGIVPPVVVTPPSISVTPATSSASIPYTTSASTTNGTFTVTGTGGTGTVTITNPTVPSGSSVTMSPTSFTIANGGTQTITFSATSPANSESTGTFTFGFSASIAGGNTATHTHTQNRAAAPPPSISVTPTTSSASIPYTTSASTTNGTFIVTGTGGTGTVTITSPTVPSGGSVTMSPTTFTIANGGTQTITFSATSPTNSQAISTFTFGFSASIAGGNTATHTHTQNRAAAPLTPDPSATCDDSGVTFPSLTVAAADNTSAKWANAKLECVAIGWRLPTIQELCSMYKFRAYISAPSYTPMSAAYYWSATQYGPNGAWGQLFTNGLQYTNNQNGAASVRCVR